MAGVIALIFFIKENLMRTMKLKKKMSKNKDVNNINFSNL